jgi:hypothetical protein
VRNRRNQVVEVHLGGTRLRTERRVAREMASRYTFEPDTTREEIR